MCNVAQLAQCVQQLKGLGGVMGAHGPLISPQGSMTGLAAGVTDTAQLQQLMTLSMLQGSASLPISAEHLGPNLDALGTMAQGAGVLSAFGPSPLSPHDLAMRQLPLNAGMLAGLSPASAPTAPASLQGVNPSVLSSLMSGGRLPEADINRLVRNMLVGGAANVNGMGPSGFAGPLAMPGLQALPDGADRGAALPRGVASPGAGSPLPRAMTPPAGLGASAQLSTLSANLQGHAAPMERATAAAAVQDVTQYSPFTQANAYAGPLEGASHLSWVSQAGLRPEDAGTIDRRRSFPRCGPSGLGRSMIRNSSIGNATPEVSPELQSLLGGRSSFKPVGSAADRPTSFSPVLKAGDAPTAAKASAQPALARSGSGKAQQKADAAAGLARPATMTSLKNSSKAQQPVANAASDAPSKSSKAAAAAPEGRAAPGTATNAASARPKAAPSDQQAGSQGAAKSAGAAAPGKPDAAPGLSFGMGDTWSKSMDISEVLRSVREGQRNGDATRSKVHALMPVSKDWEDEVCIGSGGNGSAAKGPSRVPDVPVRPPSSTGRERSASKRSRDINQVKSQPPHDSSPGQVPLAHKASGSVGGVSAEPQLDPTLNGSRGPANKRTRHDVRSPSTSEGLPAAQHDGEQQSVPRPDPATVGRSSKSAPVLAGTDASKLLADELQRAGQAWLASDPSAVGAAPDDTIIMALLLSPHLAERTRAASLVLSDPVKYARFAVLAAQCLASASAAGVPVGTPGAIGPQIHVPPFPSIKGIIGPAGPLPQPPTPFSAAAAAAPTSTGADSARSGPPSSSEVETLRALVNMHGTLNSMYDYFISQKTTHMNELHRLIASAGDAPSAGAQAEDKEDETAAVRAILKSASIMRASQEQEAIAQAEAAAPQSADMMTQRLNALNSLVTLGRLQSSASAGPAARGAAFPVGGAPPLTVPNGLTTLDPAYNALLVQQAMLAGRNPASMADLQQALLQSSGQLSGMPTPPLAGGGAAGAMLPASGRFTEPSAAPAAQLPPASGSPATAGPLPTAESDVGAKGGASTDDVAAGSAPSKSTQGSRGAYAANGMKSAFRESHASEPSPRDPSKSGA